MRQTLLINFVEILLVIIKCTKTFFKKLFQRIKVKKHLELFHLAVNIFTYHTKSRIAFFQLGAFLQLTEFRK